MRLSNISKTTALLAALAVWIGASMSANAALTLGVGPGGVAGDYILGEEIPSQPPGGLDVRDAATVNTILGMAPGARTATDYRSTTIYGTLPAATSTGALHAGSFADMTTSGANYISITLPSDQTFQYLVGAYDGDNSGVEVWNIGGVAAGSTILIPRYAQPVVAGIGHDLVDGYNPAPPPGSKYQITTWNLLDPTAVPEPTTMIAGALLLLPFGASTLRILRRKQTA